MKILAALVLALSLFLRAEPICATPVQAEATAMMTDCEQTSTHHDEHPGQKDSDAARACHACVYPPAANSVVTQPEVVFAVLTLLAVKLPAGNAIKPPTPPPRGAAYAKFQHFNGVLP
jgi:hypothetical protein